MNDKKMILPTGDDVLSGHDEAIIVSEKHHVNGHLVFPPYPQGMELAMFAMGCFWGVERRFWRLKGVYVTSVGYSGGGTVNPSYDEVCSGGTGHAEVVRLVFDPKVVSYQDLLRVFWEAHDPTQGMRQGADIGTQYRSVIYTYDDKQKQAALKSRDTYQAAILEKVDGKITTDITDASAFYFAEDYHQQYLAKNPDGYCALGGLGVCYLDEES